MTYFIVSSKTLRILDILFSPDREATAAEIEAVARKAADRSGYEVHVLRGQYTGITIEPRPGYGKGGGMK